MRGLDGDLSFTLQETQLLPGDRLVLYTDGLVEVEREDRSMLGDDGLMKLCAELPETADEAADFLVGKARELNAPVPFHDDVTLVVFDRFS